MILEAVDTPLRYEWPAGFVELVPGQPISLPDDRAKRLLAKASGKVRMVVEASQPDFPTNQEPAYQSIEIPTKSCFACKGISFWQSIAGAVVCGRCHPPANDGLVREWIHLPDAKPSAWVDPHDSRFRDGYWAFDKWLGSLRPPLRECHHPRYQEAMQQFERMDSCWLAGDLIGFRRAIENIRAIGEPKQDAMSNTHISQRRFIDMVQPNEPTTQYFHLRSLPLRQRSLPPRGPKHFLEPWLERQGYSVIPPDGTGTVPLGSSVYDQIKAQDLLYVRTPEGGNIWVKGLFKRKFGWHGRGRCWTTGMNRGDYEQLMQLAEQLAEPIVVLFFHKESAATDTDLRHDAPATCPTGLYGAKLSELSTRINHEHSTQDGTVIVYWGAQDLIAYASLAELGLECEEVPHG